MGRREPTSRVSRPGAVAVAKRRVDASLLLLPAVTGRQLSTLGGPARTPRGSLACIGGRQ
jgi:hypothetical protein